MHKEGIAPHLADVEICKPTTRYTLPDNMPEYKPADEHLLKPAHAELPLVFMTVLTQVSLGAFLALFLGQLLFSFGFNLPEPTLGMAFIAFLPGAIGLPLSALHLGRPILAMTATKNWRNSWLSREAIALALFTIGSLVVMFMYYADMKGVALLFVEAVTLALGIFGIYAQSMIYRVRARPSWNRVSTTKRFFGSSYIGFLAISFLLLLNGGENGGMVLLAITLLAGMAQVLVVYEEVLFYRHLDKEGSLYYQYNRTRILLQEHFGRIKKARLYTLLIFALGFPLLAILFVASGLTTLASITIFVATVGALLSELMGRYLFYRTVVPLGLAGNFFAGNQR